ncbi:MAG: amidohydrolase family protein [Verrucomicrobia bacterium]|nr:amidohydrolase family protein [Verrucomicrobiota bacterium]
MNSTLNRREFLRNAALGLACAGTMPAPLAGEEPAATLEPVVIDTHTHFYDPSRPQGVPWPPKDDAVLYRTVLPGTYRALPQPRAVTGTVVIEASPWLDDNQWVLDLAEKEPFIVGFVGNLPAGQPAFREQLKRFSGHPVFRGIRLRPAPAKSRWEDSRFIADLKLLAESDLSLDLVGGPEILELAARLARAVPPLRIVIDHLAGLRIDGKALPGEWVEAMQTAAKYPSVFCKVSGLVEGSGQRDGKAPRDTEFYRPTLDAIWRLCGDDRLVYGSNWPVCEHYAAVATVQRIVLEYFTAKGSAALEGVLSGNARRAYKWTHRKAR